MYDVFMAPLRCPACGEPVADAQIQTHIRAGSADGSALRVGFEFDAVDLKTENIVDAGYLLVHAPDAGRIRLLDLWVCTRCQTEQWAAVEIADRKVRDIEAVALSRATLDAANFISDTNAELLADSLQPEARATRANAVQILRQRLP